MEMESFPSVNGIDPEVAIKTADHIRSDLRPKLLRKFSEWEDTAKSDLSLMELESEIESLDKYAFELDQYLVSNGNLISAQHQSVVLNHKHQDGQRYIEAITELFFSAESLTNVHGPVMILYLATLAEDILEDGESISSLNRASFKRLVVQNMRLHVCDAAFGFSSEVEQLKPNASIIGKFKTTNGRVLDFFGVQLVDSPVTQLANFNSFAIKMLPTGFPHRKEGDVYRMTLSTELDSKHIPNGGFSVAASLMTILDMVIIMMFTYPSAAKTNLLLRISELDLIEDLPEVLTSGLTIEAIPREKKKYRINEGFELMPVDYRFAPLEEKFKRFHVAMGDQPYYRVVTT